MSIMSIARQTKQERTPLLNLPETSLRRKRIDLRIMFTLGIGALLFWCVPQNLALIKVLFGDEAQNHCFPRKQLWVWIVGVWSVLVLCGLARTLWRRWRGCGSHDLSESGVAVPSSGGTVPARRMSVGSYVTRHW